MNIEQHHCFAFVSDIDQIVQPLEQFFGLHSFVYLKIFENGSELRLTNQPSWIKHYFEKQLYAQNVFENPSVLHDKTRLLWSALPQHQVVLDSARNFNIAHGITFIEPQPDGCEYFFLGATSDNPAAMQYYCNHIDLLERFLLYFKEKAAPIIKSAEKSPFSLRGKSEHSLDLITSPAVDKEAFLRAIDTHQVQIFSQREIDCIKLLISGYTYKMIGIALEISPRTVESHIENIKKKSHCYTKSELIRYLSNHNWS